MRWLAPMLALPALLDAAGCCCECMDTGFGGERLGPTVELSADRRAAQYRVHACIDGAEPHDAFAWVDVTAMAGAGSSGITMQLAVFALTEEEPIPFEDSAIPSNLGIYTDTSAPWCSEGVSFRFERSDDSNGGTAIVDWRIALEADAPAGKDDDDALSFELIEE